MHNRDTKSLPRNINKKKGDWAIHRREEEEGKEAAEEEGR